MNPADLASQLGGQVLGSNQSQPQQAPVVHPSGSPAEMAQMLGGQSLSSSSNSQEKSVGGFVGNAVSDVGNLAGGVANLFLHPIQSAKGIGSAIMHPIQTAKSLVAPYAPGNFLNTLYEHPAQVALDASTLLGGAGFGLKAAEEGSALARAGELATKASEFTDPFSLAGKALSPVTDKIGSMLEKAPNDLYNSARNVSPKFEKTGRATGDYSAENLLMPKQVTKQLADVEAEVESKIANSGFKFSGNDAISLAKQKFVENHAGMFTDQEVNKMFDKLPVAGLKSDEVEAKFGNNLRKQLDPKNPNNIYTNPDLSPSIQKEVQTALADTLRDIIQKGTGTTKQFKKFQSLVNTAKGFSKNKTRFLPGFKDIPSMVIGSGVAGLPGAVAGVALERAATSPEAQILAARGIRGITKAGKKVLGSPITQELTAGPTRRSLTQVGRFTHQP